MNFSSRSIAPIATGASPIELTVHRLRRASITAPGIDLGEARFDVAGLTAVESPLCRSGEVLRGALRPDRCPAFGRECTPLTPLGATMVSGEGACAAYYNYGRHLVTVGAGTTGVN